MDFANPDWAVLLPLAASLPRSIASTSAESDSQCETYRVTKALLITDITYQRARSAALALAVAALCQ